MTSEVQQVSAFHGCWGQSTGFQPTAAYEPYDPGIFGFGLLPSHGPHPYNPNQDYGWAPHPLLTQAPVAIAAPPSRMAAPLVAPPQPLLPYGYNAGLGLGDGVASTGGHPFRAHNARLSVNPARLVAPVGQPVVLVAGICGDDGYFLREQPIEWSISPDSVGTIVEVDRMDQRWLYYLFHLAPVKRSGTYALGRTNSTTQVLQRGTADPSDDIQISDGQTWISISSASEGSTHVTAVAPKVEGWNERQQTATIHWVDGRWQFPAPAVSSYGGGHTLVTRVSRASDNTPVEDWLVRYEVAGGTPAAFDATGAQTIEIPTNSLGEAAATVMPQGDFSGTTQIAIQVIRRGRTPGDLARLPIGQGATSVTWAATVVPVTPTLPATPVVPAQPTAQPNLMVRVSGASIAELQSSVVYQFRVENNGNAVAENVELSCTVPAELRHVESTPQASVFGDALRWELGSLAPGMARATTVTFQVSRDGPIRVCASAGAVGLEAVTDCVVTDVRSTQAAIDLAVQGDRTGRVGFQISYDLYVSNRSDQPLANVVLAADFDEGLQHVADSYGNRRIEWPIGGLQPRETRTLPLNFIVQSAGRRCFTIRVATADGATDQEEVCVEIAPDTGAPMEPRDISPPRDAPQLDPGIGVPELSLRIRRAGADPSNPQLLNYLVDVTNSAAQSDSNVELEIIIPSGTRLVDWVLPPGVRQLQTSTDGRKHSFSQIATLRPGDPVSFQFRVSQTESGIGEFLARVRSSRYPTYINTSDRDL